MEVPERSGQDDLTPKSHRSDAAAVAVLVYQEAAWVTDVGVPPLSTAAEDRDQESCSASFLIPLRENPYSDC
jgi:hypothetical protein